MGSFLSVLFGGGDPNAGLGQLAAPSPAPQPGLGALLGEQGAAPQTGLGALLQGGGGLFGGNPLGGATGPNTGLGVLNGALSALGSPGLTEPSFAAGFAQIKGAAAAAQQQDKPKAVTAPTAQPTSGNPEEAFFQQFAPVAAQAGAAYGLPPEAFLAIPANETGFGNPKYVAGNNYFGIKAASGEPNTGPVATWEVQDGQPVNTTAAFRSYATPQESFRDFGQLILTSSLYAPALQQYQASGDRAQFIRDIHAAGYATDPLWAQKINTIAERAAPFIQQAQAAPRAPQVSAMPASAMAQQVLANASQWVGVPYVWGGTSRQGADCSGFVSSVFQELGLPFPGGRLDAEGLRKVTAPVAVDQAQPGDLIFFQGTDPNLPAGQASHVGIITENGIMLNANSETHQVQSNALTPYWTQRILGVGRPRQYGTAP